MSETVSGELDLRLVVPGGPDLALVAALRYDRSDPWAVRVGFRTGGPDREVVEWLVGRDLLYDGTVAPAGEGDVRVWPSHYDDSHMVSLAMTSPSGAALFEVELSALVDFLHRTYLCVPTGDEGEHVDLDAEVALLLAV